MPPTKRGSMPRRFMRAPICGPPPWTMTGLMPTKRSRITSSANGSLRSARSIAAPPYLMTTVLPRNSRMYGSASRSTSALRGSVIPSPRLLRASPSQNVPRQVLVAGDVAEASPHVAGVDGQLLARHLRGVEGDLLQEPLHDRVEAPRPDVLRARVHPHRDLRDRLHRVRRKPERHLLRPEQLRVLLEQEPPRLGDPHAPLLGSCRHEVRQHVLQVDPHLLHALTGEYLDHRQRLLLRLELDDPVVEPARPELGPELVLRGLARGIRR